MHVVNGMVLSTNFTDKVTLPAFNFENITVAVADNVSLTSPNTNGSIVSEADIISSEGVLHQVDSVLFYQNMSQFSGVSLVGQNTTATVFSPPDILARRPVVYRQNFSMSYKIG
jgi:hypothetical protein